MAAINVFDRRNNNSVVTSPATSTTNTVAIGNTTISSTRTLYRIELDDYSLISDFVISDKLKSTIPKAIKPILNKHWVYFVHVSPGLRLSVNRKHLQDRVNGDILLAYQYTDELSVSGNDAAYFGFITARSQEFSDAHRKCQFTSTNLDNITTCVPSTSSDVNVANTTKTTLIDRNQFPALLHIWPRKLVIYLQKAIMCPCLRKAKQNVVNDPDTRDENVDDDCVRCMFVQRNQKRITCCIRRINWSNVYVMMDNYDANCVELLKEPRSCPVCAQCPKCSNSIKYCRTHRTCKHVARPFGLSASQSLLKLTKIKTCYRPKW